MWWGRVRSPVVRFMKGSYKACFIFVIRVHNCNFVLTYVIHINVYIQTCMPLTVSCHDNAHLICTYTHTSIQCSLLRVGACSCILVLSYVQQ